MKNNTDRQPLFKRVQILDPLLGHKRVSWCTAEGEEVSFVYLGYSEEEGYPVGPTVEGESMTIEEMKKAKQQLNFDIAAMIQTFEQQSGMKVDAIRVARQGEHSSEFLGVQLEVSLNG